MEFPTRLCVFKGGPLHGKRERMTGREVEDERGSYLGGSYHYLGDTDVDGKVGDLYEWRAGEPANGSPIPGPEIDGTRD